MKFSYIARDKSEKEVRGEIDAASKLEAADKIFSEKGLIVIEIKKSDNSEAVSEEPKQEEKTPSEAVEEATKMHIGAAKTFVKKSDADDKPKTLKDRMDDINNYFISISKVSPKEKAIFFRLLAVMINAGIPIVKSLKILRDQTENKRLQFILDDVSKRVEEGEIFSVTLANHSIFSEAEVGMIAAGEESGQLNTTLEELANETEKSAALKGKIKSAMIYPITILTILIGVTVVVMTLVVPKLAELFASAGAELPVATRVLMATSDWFLASWFIVPNWLFFIIAIFAIIFAIGAFKKTKAGKKKWDWLMLHLPIFGDLHKKVALATFARQLSLLIGSGVSITRSLEITANAVDNEVYSSRLHEIREDVEQGVPINKTIENDKLFPNLVISMIAIGEQSAQLANVTKKIAQFYDEEVDSFVKNLATIMEPLIIVVVGLLVGGLVIAIMQPIMSIAEVATS